MKSGGVGVHPQGKKLKERRGRLVTSQPRKVEGLKLCICPSPGKRKAWAYVQSIKKQKVGAWVFIQGKKKQKVNLWTFVYALKYYYLGERQ